MEIKNLLLIMVIVWGTGILFRKIKLPILLGELLAGLIFGPALFGVFQDSETIQLLAELGIFFLMLHAGLETQPSDLLNSSKTSIAVALGGIFFPLGLGTGVSLLFGYEMFTALFIGTGLSITAISVTSKVFKDFKFNQSKIAHIVMGAAVADDIAAFILLSILLGAMQGGGLTGLEALLVIGKVVLFFGGVIFAGKHLIPLFKNVFKNTGHKAFTFTLIIALAFGLFAEYIGLHYILGAYLAGLFVKEDLLHPDIYKKIEDRLFGLSYSFLGPIFFVSLGFHVDFSILKDLTMFPFLIAIILSAILGKIVGAGLIAKLFKHTNCEAMIIGVSMNSRGAVELILAMIGLEMGLIDNKIFSVLIFMAFFTTFMTPILLKYLLEIYGKKQILNTEYEGV